MKKRTYPGPAVFSALVIGLGQVIKGESKKGLRWILLFYLLLPALTYTSLILSAYLFLLMIALDVIAYPVFWVYNINDAYKREV